MTYIIEYKTKAHPYHYRFLEKSNGDFVTFDSIFDARKKAMSLIKGPAILCVIRGGVEQLVYTTTLGDFVLENRDTNTWYFLKQDGTLKMRIRDIKQIGLIQSAHQIW